MRHLEERQYFRENTILFLVLSLILAAPLILAIPPFLNVTGMDNGDLYGFLLCLVLTGMTFALLLSLKTYVRLEENRIIYRSNPFWNTQKILPRNSVLKYSVSGHRWHHGLGYQLNLHFERIFVMKPGKALLIETKDRKKYRFGINRPGLVQKFMEEHWKEED